jgi:chromosomal replication initiation ATPase DnaA
MSLLLDLSDRITALERWRESQTTAPTQSAPPEPAQAMSFDDDTHLARWIMGEIAKSYRLTVHEMTRLQRPARIIRPRHLAMWLIRQHTNLSQQETAALFGRADHGTVSHAERNVTAWAETETVFRSEVVRWGERIKAHTFKPEGGK